LNKHQPTTFSASTKQIIVIASFTFLSKENLLYNKLILAKEYFGKTFAVENCEKR